MTQLQARLIILIDEWLGVALCCWCYHYHHETFWYVFTAFVVLVYGLSYPLYFFRWRRRGPLG